MVSINGVQTKSAFRLRSARAASKRGSRVARDLGLQGRNDFQPAGPLVSKPELDDYMDLFRRYGKDFGDAYLEPEDDRFRFLFDQILRLLSQPSAFNLTLPEPFRTTAYKYLAGDEAVIAHMKVVENRHFMLSDVYDYLHLIDKMGNPKQ